MEMAASYQHRIAAIVGKPVRPERLELTFHYQSVVEARLCLSQLNWMGQQLRLLRKDALQAQEQRMRARPQVGLPRRAPSSMVEPDDAADALASQQAVLVINLLLAELERIRLEILHWLRVNQ